MEFSEIKNRTPYKLIFNDNNEEENFRNQMISDKLSLRKKKLFQILMQKRQINTPLNKNENNKKDQLTQVSILIHKEDFDSIQSGLNIFYDYLINNTKLDKEKINFIFENIYYRLLDLISSNKSFEQNKYMNKILFLINYLTTENNTFIIPITEQLFLSHLKKIIEINIHDIIFINSIIPILSDMLTDKINFVQIMNEIDVVKIIKIKIGKNINNDKDNIEQLLILMNNFIMNINKDMTHKFKFILEYIFNFLNTNDIINNINILNNDDSLILICIFDILIYMSKDKKNLKIIKESNCIQLIKNIINNNKKINSNIYLLKSYEFLSNILSNLENSENKKELISYLYNDSKNGNITSGLPFLNELLESIKNKNKSFIYILINCIVSLINNCSQFCELYCSNNNLIKTLIDLFNNKTLKKIKNEIIIFFINIIEDNNIKIYKYLLNTELFQSIITFINKKIKTKNSSTNVIIYNIIYFINRCLLIAQENDDKEIFKILEKYKFKEIVEIYIESKDESISDLSRSIFIKYFSSPENTYNDNNDDMIIE